MGSRGSGFTVVGRVNPKTGEVEEGWWEEFVNHKEQEREKQEQEKEKLRNEIEEAVRKNKEAQRKADENVPKEDNKFYEMTKEQVESLAMDNYPLTVNEYLDKMTSDQRKWWDDAKNAKSKKENTKTMEQLEALNAAAWYGGYNSAFDPKSWNASTAEAFANQNGYYLQK